MMHSTNKSNYSHMFDFCSRQSHHNPNNGETQFQSRDKVKRGLKNHKTYVDSLKKDQNIEMMPETQNCQQKPNIFRFQNTNIAESKQQSNQITNFFRQSEKLQKNLSPFDSGRQSFRTDRSYGQKLKIVSTSREKSLSRESHSSVNRSKQKRGIQVTKNLLKKISGLSNEAYNDHQKSQKKYQQTTLNSYSSEKSLERGHRKNRHSLENRNQRLSHNQKASKGRFMTQNDLLVTTQQQYQLSGDFDSTRLISGPSFPFNGYSTANQDLNQSRQTIKPSYYAKRNDYRLIDTYEHQDRCSFYNEGSRDSHRNQNRNQQQANPLILRYQENHDHTQTDPKLRGNDPTQIYMHHDDLRSSGTSRKGRQFDTFDRMQTNQKNTDVGLVKKGESKQSKVSGNQHSQSRRSKANSNIFTNSNTVETKLRRHNQGGTSNNRNKKSSFIIATSDRSDKCKLSLLSPKKMRHAADMFHTAHQILSQQISEIGASSKDTPSQQSSMVRGVGQSLTHALYGTKSLSEIEEEQVRRKQLSEEDKLKYTIKYKNKTFDDLSVKQSMVMGYDHYYQ